MYKELEQTCKCGEKMVEVFGHVESNQWRPKTFRNGWYCRSCQRWKKAILRERVVKEDR